MAASDGSGAELERGDVINRGNYRRCVPEGGGRGGAFRWIRLRRYVGAKPAGLIADVGKTSGKHCRRTEKRAMESGIARELRQAGAAAVPWIAETLDIGNASSVSVYLSDSIT